MCWKCDHPESTVAEWLEAIRESVVKHGWAVQFVESDTRPYAYTIGLHEHGLPELLVTGMTPQPAVRLLNTIAEYLVEGGRPTPGHRITVADGAERLEVVQVEHPDAHMNVAVAFYGRDLHALQLVWADRNGHWPWCAEFAGGWVAQPVLGVRAGPG
jgi:hypothetical protein